MYNEITISDYIEFLEKIKIPIMYLIKYQMNDDIKYQLIMLVEFYKNTAGGRKTIETVLILEVFN